MGSAGGECDGGAGDVRSYPSPQSARETALRCSATLQDVCAAGAHLLAPRPPPSKASRDAASGSTSHVSSHGSKRAQTSLQCLYERTTTKAAASRGATSGMSSDHLRQAARDTPGGAGVGDEDDDDTWSGACDRDAGTDAITICSGDLRRLSTPHTAIQDHAPARNEDETAADVELRASKSYIVQLIDRALSREMGDGGGGSGSGEGGGAAKQAHARQLFSSQRADASPPPSRGKDEGSSTRTSPGAPASLAAPSSADLASTDPLALPPQQRQEQSTSSQQLLQKHQEFMHQMQQAMPHNSSQQWQQQCQQSLQQQQMLQTPVQLLQPASEILNKANYILVPVSGTSASSLWPVARSADEPPYMRQLRQLRWDHLKHIQREIQRLEEIERVQNGWFMDGQSASM